MHYTFWFANVLFVVLLGLMLITGLLVYSPSPPDLIVHYYLWNNYYVENANCLAYSKEKRMNIGCNKIQEYINDMDWWTYSYKSRGAYLLDKFPVTGTLYTKWWEVLNNWKFQASLVTTTTVLGIALTWVLVTHWRKKTVLRVEKEKILKRIHEIEEKVNSLLHAHGNLTNSKLKPTLEDLTLREIYEKWLDFMPIFIVHATKCMLFPHFIKDYPDVKERYRYISSNFVMVGEIEGGDFAKNVIIELSVLKLTKRQLDHMEIE